MSTTTSADLKLEIAHVLFMDVVGYSKLLINQQSDLLQRLNRIVRTTEQFRRADVAGKLVRLPTGDGMALAFFTSPDAPVRCAREISAALRTQPDLPLRMGIHSGPVDAVSDVNDRANVAGAGINMAQRVMDCGDAGHILLSRRVAEDLNQYAEWQPYLHELGEFEVKHGAKIGVVNFHGDGFGNPAVPEKLQRLAKVRAAGLRRRRIGWPLAMFFLIAALALGFWYQGLRVSRTAPPVLNILDKSIAVLPFENLSAEKDDAFFADGIQDDVLSSLGKIKDLKVIARSSVMIYRGAAAAGKLREIGQTLRVSHVLEGSVRRSANRVVINVALIDTRDDSQVWSQHYDRTLSDTLSLQGELAVEIARELRATLTPNEKVTVATKPTENTDAYLLYLKGREREIGADKDREDLIAAEQLYLQAIALDPKFALAYARASIANSKVASDFGEGDPRDEPERMSKAKAQAEAALRLAPTLGQGHLAQALSLLNADDNGQALKELSVAQTTAPNEAEIYRFSGAIYRAQGRWRESIANYQRAQDLDPRNADVADANGRNYMLVRDWPAAAEAINHALEIEPNSGYVLIHLVTVQYYSGNLATARATLAKLPLSFGPTRSIAWDLSLTARDFIATQKILEGMEEGEEKTDCRALTALARGEVTTAHRLFETLRPSYEARVREKPDDAYRHANLGLLYAYLGRKENAIREGRSAVDLTATGGMGRAQTECNLALIYARTGEADRAIMLIGRLLTTAGAVAVDGGALGSITLMDLRRRWEWDPLRSNPRFKKIVEGPEPKTIY